MRCTGALLSSVPPARFVRHFEDAARVIEALKRHSSCMRLWDTQDPGRWLMRWWLQSSARGLSETPKTLVRA